MKTFIYSTKTKKFDSITKYYLAEKKNLGHPVQRGEVHHEILNCRESNYEYYKNNGYNILVFDSEDARKLYKDSVRELLIITNGVREMELSKLIDEASKHIIEKK